MAYKRPNITMKKYIMLLMALFMSINGHTQDADGYFDITQKQDNGNTLRHIQSPNKSIQNSMIGNLESKAYVAYYNILTSESFKNGGKKLEYKLGFLVMKNIDFNIPKNSRLLIKLKNNQTITLSTKNGDTGTYDSISGLDRYYTSTSYVITMQQLNKIITIGVSKLRIEIQTGYCDIEPNQDISLITKEYKAELYDRLNKKKDAFNDNF